MQTNPLESHAGLLRLFEAKARKRGASTESPQARNMNDTPDAINALLTTVKKMLSAYGWTQGCTEDEYVRSAGAERQLVISVIRNVVEGELRWFDLHLYRGVNDAVEHPPSLSAQYTTLTRLSSWSALPLKRQLPASCPGTFDLPPCPACKRQG